MNLILNAIQWGKVGLVLGIISGLAIIFAVLILIVTKVCNIQEDEKVLKIIENLPGANCGGCGHSGCGGFAKCLADGTASLSECKVTTNEAKAVIAKIADIPFEADVPTVCVVKCYGGTNSANKFEYVGNPGCVNQMVIQGGRKICATACLGGGSCVNVCPVDAIKIVDEVARIDKTLCISCGACINICPKLCIERIPANAPIYVACSTHCRGKETTSFCKVGCIGCGICAKNCPSGAIKMENYLPVIDYTKCTGCEVCVTKCPRKIIKVM